MPPGEPIGSAPDPDKEKTSKTDDGTKKYTPEFSPTDWFVEPLINFNADTSSMETVYEAVKYWAQLALDLKQKGYPLAEGIDNWKEFDEKTVKKARMLDDFLDQFITKKMYSIDKEYEILRVLIAQGKPYLEFREKMSAVNFSLKCNTIWENDAVAYRCNTCAFTPCMSLCEACFDANGHQGHDYTRFFSREGGACDCGNQDVIREQGNCPAHGDESKRPKYDMTDVCLAEHIIMKLLVRLFLSLRGWANRQEMAERQFRHDTMDHLVRHLHFDLGEFTERDAGRVKKLVDFLQECSNYGGPMRQIVAEVLMNKDLYRALNEKTGDQFDESGRVELNLDWRTAYHFEADRITVLSEADHNFTLFNKIEDTECHCLLDELIFWINRELFPQNLVNFGLSLLSEPGYRDAFAFRFFAWYPICGKVIGELCTSQSDHTRTEDRVSPACSRAVHVTVQMLSSAQLCKELNEKVLLVKTIFDVTRFLICERLVDSEISLKACNTFKERARFLNMTTTAGRPKWKTMTMHKNAAINHHGYWFVMGDIQNVLTHTPLAVQSVFDEECFGGTYMKMMCQMQGMNPIWRIISGNALENDQGEEVQRAYTLEFETLAVTLFNIVAAIQQEKSLEAAKTFFGHIKKQLVEWFQVLLPIEQDENGDGLDMQERDFMWGGVLRAQAYTVSFHIPLHRHISTALTHFVELPGFYDYIHETLLQDEALCRLLLIHPLRIQVARAEINCNMWVRNGATARMSALIYSQWNVSSAFQTPDVDLIRFCAAHIEKDHFVEALTTSFNLTESIKVSRGNYVESVPELRSIFRSVNGQMEPDPVPEYKKAIYAKYRKMIRDHAVLIDRTILGYVEGLTREQDLLREEVFRIMNQEGLATELNIDFQIEVPVTQHVRTDPRLPLIGEFIRRHLAAGGVDENAEIEELDREYDPAMFDDEDTERRTVIRDAEWIDSMFWGMFKLISELIVVRVNSGATSEEHYRSEMVNCMAMGNVPYSRLRASISEKGSRGSEMIDKHFERILREIGDFNAPTECSTHLQQGSYRLKTTIWDSEVCPVFFMMRSSTIKHAREVFSKMADREKKNCVDRGTESSPSDIKYWVPFRLISFEETKRHQGIAGIYNVLLSERLLIHCITVLACETDEGPKFHDCTVQLAVYLMTLGVKYVQQYQKDQETRLNMIDIYHTPFEIMKERDLDFHYHITISSFMIRLLKNEVKKLDQLVPVFGRILSGFYDQGKVSGGRMVYLARFISILCSISPTTRELIQERYDKEVQRLDLLKSQSSSTDRPIQMDPVKQAAKEAAKRRMEAIMQNSAKKSAITMEKLMKTEGMSVEEVNTVDPSQQNRKMYQCPICGEVETPNTVDRPFGMLAKLTTNFVCEEQIDASLATVDDLLQYDSVHRDNEEMKATRRIHLNQKKLVIKSDGTQAEMTRIRAPMVGTDPKTCGHTAHIDCFNAYRASLYDGRDNHSDALRQVHCPLCRHQANIIIPIALDKPYIPIKTPPPAQLTFSDAWRIMDSIVIKAKMPVFEDPDALTKYKTNYSTSKGGGLYELFEGRKSSADRTEQSSTLEPCTPSTYLVSLATAIVERSSLLRSIGAPERRKQTRSCITEHIMTASVASSQIEDFDVAMSAMTNLFATVIRTDSGFKTTPPSDGSPAPSTSREGTPVTMKKEEEVAGLSAEEMAALAMNSPSTSSTPSTSKDYTLQAKNDYLRLPLYLLDPKPTLVRMLSLLIDHQSIPKEIKQSVAHQMIVSSLGWVTSWTLLCLAMRLGEQKIRGLASGELKIHGLEDQFHAEMEEIAKGLMFNADFFEHIMQLIQESEVVPSDTVICETLQRVIIDFLKFSIELLVHCNLAEPEKSSLIHGKDCKYDEALRIMDISQTPINIPGKASYWTLTYRNNLMWMVKIGRGHQPIISQPLAWKPRRILRPPKKFEELFSRYFHRDCMACSKTPSMPIICLFCGELLCLDECCNSYRNDEVRKQKYTVSEIESHSQSCSSSAGLFISLTSSMIIVCRGNRASLWGTVYLDAHKEEDRNLKRGKPLFLCETRLKWLEFDWAEQEWQRVYGWYSMQHQTAFINSIRECHLHH